MRIFLIFSIFILVSFIEAKNYEQQDTICNRVEKQIQIIENCIDQMIKKKNDITVEGHNEFIHWVLQKDEACEQITKIYIQGFLQKSTNSDDEHLNEKLTLAQKMIEKAYQIKLHADKTLVEEMKGIFADWKQITADNKYYKRDYRYYRYKKKNSS